MSANNDEQLNQQPPAEPGTLAPWDYSPEKTLYKADFSEKAYNELKAMCDRANKRDMASRRWEVEQAWKQRLFDRGYQYLLPRKGGGWALPNDPVYGKKGSLTPLETDIYSANEQIIVSALTRDIPGVVFEPQDPENDADITAADAAKDFKDIFVRNNDLMSMQTDESRYLWTDGRCHIYTRFVLDAQRFGVRDGQDETAVVPEDETQADAGGIGAGGEQNNSPDGSGGDSGDEGIPSPDNGDVSKPRGQEIADCYGKLEVKVPMATRGQQDYHFLAFAKEYDVTIAKSLFPWVADEIKPSAGPGENQLDRIARINCQLALTAQYTTGESMVSDVTVQRTWFRPSAFMEIQDVPVRQELMQLFPKGALAVYAGDTFAFARNENMDDHWSVSYATRGDGQNRASLGQRMVSLQERVNNLVDLLYEFFVRTIPRRYMDSVAFDIEALKTLAQQVGMDVPFKRQPGVPTTELIFTDPVLPHQPELPEFIWKCIEELSQLLSGAYPALSGGDTEGNDTASGISMQRSQALGRLAVPWHSMQSAASMYFKQAVECAAVCRPALGEHSLKSSIDGSSVEIELADLKGNVLCFPEVDGTFPESQQERQARASALLQDAANNPIVQQMMTLPQNLKKLKDDAGYADYDLPDTDSYDKQMGELDLLLKQGPIPNPQLIEAQSQLQMIQQKVAMEGPLAAAQAAPLIQQAQQAMGQIPPEISTVPIDEQTDNHAAEAAALLKWINSPAGRKMRNGTPQEKLGFANARVHYLQHQTLADQKAAAMAAQAQKQKVGESVNFKDLPPDGQQQMAAQAGIHIAPPPPEPAANPGEKGMIQ